MAGVKMSELLEVAGWVAVVFLYVVIFRALYRLVSKIADSLKEDGE